MASLTTEVKRQVWRVAETAADTTWSDIAKHLDSIDRVTWALPERFDLDADCLEACEAIRKITVRARKLQQFQRSGYSFQADDGIQKLAHDYIPHVVNAAHWPRHTHMDAWLENITLSCERIAALAKQRQAAHGGEA